MKREIVRTVETALAVGVLLVVWVISTEVPVEYPSWPEVAGVPANPELLVPGALAVVVLVSALRTSASIVSGGIAAIKSARALWTAGIGLLAALTLFLSVVSLYTLYADTGGCVFFGGLLTLSAGIPLALLVLGRQLFDGVAGWYRRRHVASE
ncbi:hypothetical protein C479_09543 [Halovivax asiaticus JCM 14624]|uniref:Uncharacterized protein n=1 Tax=Halovivax asiaticus JCM 14624 TaxID=1227490 RepID=M0BN75_9EURY|nr:hypothetical protein [Halovivax asiaticus]ELZ11044.1 hypothetical protein C479_09543 [Halovivax asiaticus JCM 14624]